MRSHAQERGSVAHIVIIVVLALGLIGALGFIFWQNFVDKSTSSRTDTDAVTIAEWGVDIPVQGEYAYELDGEYATVYPKALTDAEEKIGCEEKNGVRIYRTATTGDLPDYMKEYTSAELNSNYLVLQRGNQTLCVSDNDDGSDTTNSEVNEIYEAEISKFKAAWVSIVETN
jgi:hypothetical protein